MQVGHRHPPPPFPVLAIALDVGKGVLVQVIARASERVLARDFPRVLPVILRGLHRAGHQKRDQEPRAHAGRWRGGETRAGTHQEAAAGAPAHGAEGRHPRVLVLGVRRAVAHGVQGRLAGLALQGATRVSRKRAAGGGVAAAAGVSGIGAVGGRSKVAQAYVYIIIGIMEDGAGIPARPPPRSHPTGTATPGRPPRAFARRPRTGASPRPASLPCPPAAPCAEPRAARGQSFFFLKRGKREDGEGWRHAGRPRRWPRARWPRQRAATRPRGQRQQAAARQVRGARSRRSSSAAARSRQRVHGERARSPRAAPAALSAVCLTPPADWGAAVWQV